MARSAASVLIAISLALLSPVSAEPADLDLSVMAAGDECAMGSDDGRCALNALQVRRVTAQALANSNTSCSRDTGGTCRVGSCDKSRGPAECSRLAGHKCLCPMGWCAVNGVCFPGHGQCSTDTGGTCTILDCASSRGSASCTSNKCICNDGNCAHKGRCYPVTDTGGTCELLGCYHSRGPTICRGGKCLCKDGYVAMNGKCEQM